MTQWWATLALAFTFQSEFISIQTFAKSEEDKNNSFLRELLPVYQDTILPLADVAIPNQFEAELLTGAALEANIKLWSNQARPSQTKRKPWQWWKSCTKREYPRLSSQGGSRREIPQIFKCLSQHWARKQWPLGGSGQLQQDQHKSESMFHDICNINLSKILPAYL